MTGKKPIVSLVVGARPNFVKAAPILQEIKRQEVALVDLIHTGQHYDYSMSKSFFDLFSLPEPHRNLGIGSGGHGEQTGKILIEFEKLVIEERPDMVLVLGDVNSTLAAALVAAKLNLPVAHIEAGLRSFDRRMPEEINRILTDHVSDFLFVTEKSGVVNLQNEGIASEKIHLVGNVMIDALRGIEEKIDASGILGSLGVKPFEYSTVTLHRPSNVDNPDALRRCLSVLKVAARNGAVVFPVHPRTAKSICSGGMKAEFDRIKGLLMTSPLRYEDFMCLIKSSSFIMTDSGGIQSEASYLKTPCITLRESTEHQITLSEGTNRLTGFDQDAIKKAIEDALVFDRKSFPLPSLLDGKASTRIVSVISQYLS